jgi:hypothetical protein
MELTQDGAQIAEDQRGEREAIRGHDRATARTANGQDLTGFGADVEVGDLAAALLGKPPELGDRLGPRPAIRREELLAAGPEDGALAHFERVADASLQERRGVREPVLADHRRHVAVFPVGMSANIETMDLGRSAWITVIGICLIAVVMFAVNGYTGYAITVGAVGAAAAVNLT